MVENWFYDVLYFEIVIIIVGDKKFKKESKKETILITISSMGCVEVSCK